MRGMKKWLPFKSLNGQEEVLNNYIQEKKKVEKPELSEDESQLLNAKLSTLQDGDMLIVTYFQEGQIVDARTTYRKYDETTHQMYFDRLIVKIDNILDIVFGDGREEYLQAC